jgi:hypothetical protein
LVPVNRSTSVALPVLPTAVHAMPDVHDTPLRLPPPDPNVGVGSIHQRVPFQCSARVPVPADPTAVQAVAEKHDTPVSSMGELTPMGLGVV